MPKGPKGQKRPGDVIGTAIKVAKIATGEVEDEKQEAAPLPRGKAGGLKGGMSRASKLTAERRSEIAKKAAAARWLKGRLHLP